MLDEAGARTPRRLDRGSVRYALMDLRRLELPEESCRGVWCSASLLHIPKRTAPRAAGELARVARAGAPVVVFLMRREREVEEELVPYPVPGIVETPRFYAYYEPQEARGLLEGSGLEILQQEIVPDGRPDAPSWVAIMARRPER